MGPYIVENDFAAHPESADRLVAALERNQRWWLLRVGAAGAEIVHRRSGVIWFDSKNATGSIYVPFPAFSPSRIGEELDAFVGQIRAKATRRPVWLWASAPPIPDDLPLRLMARGFRHGFQPHWMWLDLAELRDDFQLRRKIHLEFDPDPELWDAKKNADYIAEGTLARTLPGRAKQIVAWADGKPIGTSCVFLTRGTSGIAGIYDVGVLPEYRNLGIGKALTHAACVWAQEQGYRTAGLNATPMGEPVYRALGFQSLRWAQTWQLPVEVQAQPLSETQVAFAEAIGSGDIARLDRAELDFIPLLKRDLPCHRTPLQLATHFKQRSSAEWLVAHGAQLDLLSCWDLGWFEQAHELITGDPEIVNARFGEWRQTALHEAASRGDLELVQILIDAGADLQARDGTFHSRPLEWAQHFNQPAAAALLKSRMR